MAKKKAGTIAKKAPQKAPKKATLSFDALAAHQVRAVEVEGVMPDGSAATIFYRAHTAAEMIDAIENATTHEGLSDTEKFVAGVDDLAKLLVNEDGSQWASADKLMQLPFDTIMLMRGAINRRVKEQAEEAAGGNDSGEASTDASPTD